MVNEQKQKTWTQNRRITTGEQVYLLNTYGPFWKITTSHGAKAMRGIGKPPWPPAPFRVGDEVRRKNGKPIYDQAWTAKVTSIQMWTNAVYVLGNMLFRNAGKSLELASSAKEATDGK